MQKSLIFHFFHFFQNQVSITDSSEVVANLHTTFPSLEKPNTNHTIPLPSSYLVTLYGAGSIEDERETERGNFFKKMGLPLTNLTYFLKFISRFQIAQKFFQSFFLLDFSKLSKGRGFFSSIPKTKFSITLTECLEIQKKSECET